MKNGKVICNINNQILKIIKLQKLKMESKKLKIKN